MDVPIEPALRALLCQGNVFYFSPPEFGTSQPHNFVLLNKRPSEHAPLYFVCATSQVDKIRAAYAAEPTATLVPVTTEEYRDFTRPTLFNCNRILTKSFDDFVRLVSREGRIKPRDRIGPSILKRLIDGVAASNYVPENIKQALV